MEEQLAWRILYNLSQEREAQWRTDMMDRILEGVKEGLKK